MMIRYITEAAARDGNAAICISLLPDGSLDDGSRKMLQEVGVWMRRNGEGIYGSHAWKIPGEGEIVNGNRNSARWRAAQAPRRIQIRSAGFPIHRRQRRRALRVLPDRSRAGNGIENQVARHGRKISQPAGQVGEAFGYGGDLQWKQEADGLVITCPAEMPFVTAVAFPDRMRRLKTENMRIHPALLVSAFVMAGSCVGVLATTQVINIRDRSFDSGWRFLRADAPGAEAAAFDDSQWRTLDVPHDWASRIGCRAKGRGWNCRSCPASGGFKGDDARGKRELDDSGWQKVTLPDNWEHHSNYTEDNVYGWYRRRIEIPADLNGKDFDLLLGCVDDVDEAFLNGERIGGTGSFPPDYKTA